jgi:uncharacterized iron-regulated protein
VVDEISLTVKRVPSMRALMLITFAFLYALAPLIALAQNQQKPASDFRVYDASGKLATIDEIVAAMDKAEVVFIGETHNDAVGHQVELGLLQAAAARYNQGAGRQLALSLEMFERDVQTTLDEYLGGLILERQLISDARPWSNYQSDYRPLVEFAREKGMAVIAANVPTRYANMVARAGRNSLDALSPQAKVWLAPLPYGEASTPYAAKFQRAMQGMGGGHEGKAMQNFLDAQVLRDATMAHSIAQALKARQKALVLHVTGIFHVEGRMGIPEQLEKYRPQTRFIVIALVPASEVPKTDAESLRKLGDFVVVTQTAQQ